MYLDEKYQVYQVSGIYESVQCDADRRSGAVELWLSSYGWLQFQNRAMKFNIESGLIELKWTLWP